VYQKTVVYSRNGTGDFPCVVLFPLAASGMRFEVGIKEVCS
jgi:hypothetical protein